MEELAIQTIALVALWNKPLRYLDRKRLQLLSHIRRQFVKFSTGRLGQVSFQLTAIQQGTEFYFTEMLVSTHAGRPAIVRKNRVVGIVKVLQNTKSMHRA
jgi:hypothetical protein